MRLQKHSSGKRKYVKGDHLVVSDQSGLVYRASEVVRQWDGLIVGKDELERRHPQEFVRGVPDNYAVRNPRPRAPYEATLDSSTPEGGINPLVDRNGNNIISRLGDNIVTRGDPFSASDPLFTVDIGSVKDVSAVEYTATHFPNYKDLLNIYTSEDGVTYIAMDQPFVDMIRDFTLGVSNRVPIGRQARYIQMRFEPVSGQVQAAFTFSQFDVIGEV